MILCVNIIPMNMRNTCRNTSAKIMGVPLSSSAGGIIFLHPLIEEDDDDDGYETVLYDVHYIFPAIFVEVEHVGKEVNRCLDDFLRAFFDRFHMMYEKKLNKERLVIKT